MDSHRKKSETIDLVIAQEKKKRAMKNLTTGLLIVIVITLIVAALATISTMTREFISGPTLEPASMSAENSGRENSVPVETALKEIVIPGEGTDSADLTTPLDPIAQILARQTGVEPNAAPQDNEAIPAGDPPPTKKGAELELAKAEADKEPVPVLEIVAVKQMKKDVALQATKPLPKPQSELKAEKTRPEPQQEKIIAEAAKPASHNIPGKYPLTSIRILTKGDLAGMTASELKIMRNEIFARHGYVFRSKSMKNHFASQSWYTPKHTNVTKALTPIEVANVEFIRRIAKKRAK